MGEVMGRDSPPLGSSRPAPIQCPWWFFVLAGVLLLPRPLLLLVPPFPFALPGNWENLGLAVLLLASVLAHPFPRYLGIVGLWATICLVIESALPLGFGYRFVALLGLIEGVVPQLVPAAWCVLWFFLPAASPGILGEPLAPPFLAGLILFSLWMAWRTTAPKWRSDLPPQMFLEFFLGLSLGFLVVFLPPHSLPIASGELPTIFVDEAHDSSESAAGTIPLLNGHQEFVSDLQRCGFPVRWCRQPEDFPASGSGILVTILPRRPFSAITQDRIAGFVSSGGAFLAILDHTDMDGAASRLSPLWERFGILPGFETLAWPGLQGFGAGLSSAVGWHRGFPGTGGTLLPEGIWLPAAFFPRGVHPLCWVSAAAWPEEGEPGGNLNHQMSAPPRPVTRRGPFWTGAWGTLGEGRWAVLADSSWFQNGQGGQNQAFRQGLLGLLSRGVVERPLLPWATALLFITFVFVQGYRRLGKFLLPVGCLFGLWFGWFLLFPQEGFRWPWASSPSIGASSSADVSTAGPSFLPLVPAGVALASSPRTLGFLLSSGSPSQMTADQPVTFDTNLDVFLGQFHRAGFRLRFFHPREALPGKCRIWVLPPLDAPPNLAILQELQLQVTKGTTLILLGDPHSVGSVATFRFFGFGLEGDPDAQAYWERDSAGLPRRSLPGPFRVFPTHPGFLGSWTAPLWCDRPIRVTGGEAVLATEDGRPIVAGQRSKEGFILAVGDPRFFANGALEVRGRLDDPEKKAFLGYLAHRLAGGGS